MHILHLEASPGWGGQEIRILREAEGMRARGHEVFFAVMRGGALGRFAKVAGFTAYSVAFQKVAWPFTLFQLLYIFWKHRIDLVNTHSSLDSWIGGIAARLARKKILRTRHLSTPVKAGFNSRFVYGTLADFVVTTCEAIIPSLSSQSGKPLSLFHSVATGVNPSQIQPEQNEIAAFRRKLGISTTDFLVGTACFMRSWKGIEDFLQAADRLRDIYGAPLGSVNFGGEIFCPSSVAAAETWRRSGGPSKCGAGERRRTGEANSESLQERAMRWDKKDAEKNSLDLTAGRIKWVIVGGGHAERYRKLAKDMALESIVFFTGHLENPFPAIAAFDAFALLSTAHEGVSQAILQAAYLKKPLIATPTGGLSEVCLQGKTGLQVPPHSAEAVAEAVMRLKENPTLCAQFGLRAHQLVLERFTFQHTLDTMETIYRRMTMELEWKDRLLQYYLFHKNRLYGYIAGGIGVFALLIVYLASGPSGTDILAAKGVVADWKQSPTDEHLLQKMQQVLKQFPGLERAMEAEIAQTFIAAGMVETAEPLVRNCIDRLKKISPLHADFAETSLMIERKEYQKALEKSVALKEQMERTMDSRVWKGDRIRSGSALYACNLLRVAFLQKELKNGPGELAAWEEVKGLIELEGESSAAAQFLQANFSQKSYSLLDFISQRERSIVY